MKGVIHVAPTIRDVAARARVSPATVSRALNNDPQVKAGTRERVLEVAHELGFVPNATAKSLRTRRTGIIGAIVPDVSTLFFLEIVKGIENTLSLSDYRVTICDSQNQLKKEKENARWLLDGSVDGLILLTPMMDDPSLCDLAEKGYPIGVFGRAIDHPAITCVGVDNYAAGLSATKHLIGHGHTDIAVITGPEGHHDSQERLRGFQDTLHQQGLSLRPERIQCGGFTEEGGVRAFHAIVDRGAPPTAIFALNDEMAIGVLQAAQASGLRVPQDLAVIGFDNVRLARVVTPALTTVNQPKLDAGFRLAQNILNRLSGSADTERITLPADLVVRHSCGC